jgi:hypothetical protein
MTAAFVVSIAIGSGFASTVTTWLFVADASARNPLTSPIPSKAMRISFAVEVFMLVLL